MEVLAGVLELADGADSKSVVGNNVWVQVPPPAPLGVCFILFLYSFLKVRGMVLWKKLGKVVLRYCRFWCLS